MGGRYHRLGEAWPHPHSITGPILLPTLWVALPLCHHGPSWSWCWGCAAHPSGAREAGAALPGLLMIRGWAGAMLPRLPATSGGSLAGMEGAELRVEGAGLGG